MNFPSVSITPILRATRWRIAIALSSFFLVTNVFANCDAANANCDAQGQTASAVSALQSPLAALQSHLRKRGIDPNELTAAGMVDVMLDWYRSEPMAAQDEDELVFSYGGWSEGCATGFKFSLLRRIAGSDEERPRLAGITMMFEPSGRGEFPPFSAESGDAKSLEAFAAAIRGSRAYKLLVDVAPLGVMVETGGLR